MFEEGHASACETRRWVLNEKRLLDGAGVDAATARLAAPGGTGDELRAMVADVCRLLDSRP